MVSLIVFPRIQVDRASILEFDKLCCFLWIPLVKNLPAPSKKLSMREHCECVAQADKNGDRWVWCWKTYSNFNIHKRRFNIALLSSLCWTRMARKIYAGQMQPAKISYSHRSSLLIVSVSISGNTCSQLIAWISPFCHMSMLCHQSTVLSHV